MRTVVDATYCAASDDKLTINNCLERNAKTMKKYFVLLAAMALLAATLKAPANAQIAGKSGANDLVIAQDGTTKATVVVAADAGPYEKRAAEDLVKYIEMMSGAKPELATGAVPDGHS